MPQKTKKANPFSATKYSTEWFRKNGYIVGKTEMNQRVPNPAFPGQFKMWKVDLFGCVDLLALKPGELPIFCQTTTTSNQANRIDKIAGLESAKVIVGTGHAKLHVHGWGKKGPRGGRKTWRVTITEIGYDSDGLLTTKVISGGSVEDEEPAPPLLETAEDDDGDW